MKKRDTIIILALIVLLFALSLFHPSNLQKETENPQMQTLLSSIVVDESARFHPLLKSGNYHPLPDARLTSLDAYLLLNAETGEVYSAKNATQKVSPASLVKLMTAMVALDVSTPSAKLKASPTAAVQEPTILGMTAGEIFRLDELVPAMIMTSANDAAAVIGEETLKKFGAGESLFIELMNRKAELLGLGKTHFTNTQGFDAPDQYSNAYDLARLAKYASSHYPLIRESASIPYAALEKNSDHGFYHLPNWNALLGTYPGVDGLKIGYTEKSGFSTIVTATRKGVSVIVVLLGAEGIIERDLAAASLLNTAFAKEGEKEVVVSESLIKPRLDEWRDLRNSILKTLELE